jgi:SEC-C motif-containing protein
MSFSINSLCPCGSREKYKKCCLKYHKGAHPSTALLLMKSRYSAYALGRVDYIIETTHPEHTDFSLERASWREEIQKFSDNTDFLGLRILSFHEEKDKAYVDFIAVLSSGELHEKSTFFKVGGKWLYYSGLFES